MFGVPLEYLMFGGIGFCIAWLTALMVLPAVHNRAVRLAKERYDDLPLSIQEIRAEKDTIRAGFAAATRELEIRIEALREKTVAHATDLARKNQLIERLKQEVGATTSALRESETRENAARDELREAKRGFAGKDVSLDAAEDRITALQRELASKESSLEGAARDLASTRNDLSARDTALRAAERDAAAMRGELSARESGLTGVEKQIASLKADLRESRAREQAARDELSEAARGYTDKIANLGAFEGKASAMQRELAERDEALRSAERDMAALRNELAGKDTALNRAEKEIVAIRAEIGALSKLLVQMDTAPAPRVERDATSPRLVEVVPFVPAPRSLSQPQAVRETLPRQPHAETQPLRQTAEPLPLRPEGERPVSHTPIDVIPVPSRLIPPTIPQAPRPGDDGVRQALTEITDAAHRIDEQPTGPNQRLRAIYAPLIKGSN